jgi:hypothetical protein
MAIKYEVKTKFGILKQSDVDIQKRRGYQLVSHTYDSRRNRTTSAYAYVGGLGTQKSVLQGN